MMDRKLGANERGENTYSRAARRLHWWTVAGLSVQIPIGLFMVRYGAATNFAPPTGTFYDGHKLLGRVLMALATVRLIYRFTHGAPAPEPSLSPWQVRVSHGTHWAIYALLLLVPLLGWLAVSFYGAFAPFGISLPALAQQNPQEATRFFLLHTLAAYALILLIGLHIAAALFHYVIRKDGVMRRMLVAASRRQ